MSEFDRLPCARGLTSALSGPLFGRDSNHDGHWLVISARTCGSGLA